MKTPSWYDPKECGVLRFPNIARAAACGAEYASTAGLKPRQRWEDDDESTVLAVIDCQIDFVNPQGALCVPGAVEDTDRLCRFIYENVERISHIVASLDSHYIFQPFHPMNWAAGSKPTTRFNGVAYREGEHPDPFTIITLQDVRDGVWNALKHPKRMQEYLHRLETTGKKNLCIWPFHCLMGTPGQAWEPSFAEAMAFHAAARRDQYDATTKGMSQLSEHYGILGAEVEFPDDPNTQLNTRVLTKWERAQRIIFAGQAKSHCCLATLEQVVANFTTHGKNHLLSKMFVLEDCMSSVPDVVLPNGGRIEFDRMANERFAEFKKLGVKFIKSDTKL